MMPRRIFLLLFLIIYRFSCDSIMSSRTELIGETWTATNFNQLNTESNWCQLSFEDQRKLLDYDIEFQGIQIPLKYVLAAESKSFQFLQTSDVLGHKMRLGVDVRFNVSGCNSNRLFLQNDTKSFSESRQYDEVVMDTIIDDSRMNKGVHISDVPEEDIPNLSKEVAQQIKKKMPWYWIVSLDFQRADNVADRFECGKALSEYISKHILNLTNFEGKAFQDIFASNRVIFLVTLSADVSIQNVHKEINLLNQIKWKSDNQLWILSSERKLDLASLLCLKVYRQLPIEDEYQMPSQSDWEGKIDRLKAKDHIEWRLQLSAWANATIENSTDSDTDPDSLDETLYGIFKHYTDVIIRSTESPTLTTADVELIYQNRALQILFPNYYQAHLVESWFPNLPSVDFSELNFDQNYTDSDGIHPVIAEFFVVDFFRQRLYASNTNETDSIPITFKVILTNWNQYGKVRSFLDDVHLSLFADTQTEALNRAVQYFKQFYTIEELRNVFMLAVCSSDKNTVKIVAKTFENNSVEFCEFLNYEDGPVNQAAEFQPVDLMEWLLKLLSEQLDVGCFKNLFLKKGIMKRNLIFISARRIDNFDFLLNHPIVPLTSKEKGDFLVEFDEHGNSILHDLISSRLLNVLKAMGQWLDKEQATKLLKIEDFFDRFNTIQFDLVGPELFDNLLHWSEAYSLNNVTRKIFNRKSSRSVLQSANIFVLEAFWTLFETCYRSTTERKIFLGHNEDMFKNAMYNKDRKIFSFVKEKYDMAVGPQKSKDLIWQLISNSIDDRINRGIDEIQFYWPFFEEIYPNKNERISKLKEIDVIISTLKPVRKIPPQYDQHSPLWKEYAERLNKEKIKFDRYSFIRTKYHELLDEIDMQRAKISDSHSA